jgi:aldehyde oxidoreductase
MTPTASRSRSTASPVTVRRSHPHLLAALREELDITSPKDGCSPSGQCGCCTVFVDGKAIVACQCDMDKVEGSSVVTLEGVDEAERTDVRRRVRGVRRPAVRVLHPRHRDAGQVPDRQEGCVADPRVDGAAPRRPPLPLHRVRQGVGCDRGGRPGHRLFAGAVGPGRRRRRQVRGRRRSRSATAATSTTSACRACCTPRCTSPTTRGPTSSAIDTSAALAAPGVEAVFTADDLPGELRVGLIHKDWPVMIPVGGRTSYAGDVLAVVVADTRDHARAAASSSR